MAHAIDYPRIPRDVVPATGKTRPNVSTRLLRSIQKAQMARARREIALYAPHIAAQMEIGVYRELDPAEGESLR